MATKPGKLHRPLIYILLFTTHFSISCGSSIPAFNFTKTGERVCGGSEPAECGSAAVEVEAESSRRVLAMARKYISYDTLRRDMVPCMRPGASYYSCRSAPVNHYHRGCEAITRCARDTSDVRT